MSSERYYVPGGSRLIEVSASDFVTPPLPPDPGWKYVVLAHEHEAYVFDNATGRITAQMRVRRYGDSPADMRRSESVEGYMMRKLGWVEPV